jgi:hypothetical protein
VVISSGVSASPAGLATVALRLGISALDALE